MIIYCNDYNYDYLLKVSSKIAVIRIMIFYFLFFYACHILHDTMLIGVLLLDAHMLAAMVMLNNGCCCDVELYTLGVYLEAQLKSAQMYSSEIVTLKLVANCRI